MLGIKIAEIINGKNTIENIEKEGADIIAKHLEKKAIKKAKKEAKREAAKAN